LLKKGFIMSKEEEIEQLLEDIAWLEQEIKDAIDDPYLDEFGKAYLKNLINYWKRDRAKLMKLINKK